MYFFFLLFSILQAEAHVDDKEKLIKNIVDLYRPLASEQFQKDIVLTLKKDDPSLNASAGHMPDGSIEVTVFGGVLEQLEESEIIFVLCHEIGHIFGKTFEGKLYRGEGEADYFAGSCVLNILHDIDSAERSIMGSLEKLYSAPIDYSLAETRKYPGIQLSYPDKECRVLSALRGLREEPRPACWFNPLL
ncbi:MAG TPA: M48 family metalloprotease [Bacteriovoracaceae bacterium]|nr:M48 family metalloprotease [Bacteriovoracaceae bacterium]